MSPAIRTALYLTFSLGCVVIPTQSTATDQASGLETSNPIASTTDSAELAQLDRNLALQPGRVDLRFHRARVLESLGRTEAAMREYRWLLDNYPELPEAYNNMARLLAQGGELEQAISLLEHGLATHPVYQLMFNNMRNLFDSMAQQAYRAALTEPVSSDDGVLSDKVVHVELKGVESIDAPQVVEGNPARRTDSTASLQQHSADTTLEPAINEERQVVARDE